MMLDADQRRALALLAKAGARGCTETMMQAFSPSAAAYRTWLLL
jgi:hypothetical protein